MVSWGTSTRRLSLSNTPTQRALSLLPGNEWAWLGAWSRGDGDSRFPKKTHSLYISIVSSSEIVTVSAVDCVRRGTRGMCMRCRLIWTLRWRPLLWTSTNKRHSELTPSERWGILSNLLNYLHISMRFRKDLDVEASLYILVVERSWSLFKQRERKILHCLLMPLPLRMKKVYTCTPIQRLATVVLSFSPSLLSPSLSLSLPLFRYLYELFDPFSVTLYIAKSSKRLYDIQCELYKAVNTELTGLEIMRPHAITLGTKSSAPLLRSQSNGAPNHINGTPSHSSNGVYTALTHKHNPGHCTDYYVVMSPNRAAISEHDSDVSGESTTSEHFSIMAQHSHGVDDKLGRVMEELQGLRGEMAKMQVFTEHLRKFCESLQNQIRMTGTGSGGGGGGMGGGVDNRAPAILPGETLEFLSTVNVLLPLETLEFVYYIA